MRRISLLAAVAAAMALSASPARAVDVTIFSFEDQLNPGYVAFSGNPAAVVGTSTTGATDGLYSLQVNAPSGFSQGLNYVVAGGQEALYQNILNAEQYAYDFTVLGSLDASTFHQSRPFLNYRSNTNSFPFVEGAFVNIGGGTDATVTVVVDIPDDLAPLDHPDGFFLRLGVTTNGDAPFTYYMDKVRLLNVVPEPSCLGLLLLGGAFAFGYRHRNS